ncbi:type II toxin-antitoxin system Phd/YefM family antitoxin [Candidatus Leptofilum sp.]|uniref:type II toxin-antitoxin system Phd/YefM family antitoxin n=1 Tax=Candidatus Leptofilum sp. TaxID=3241576 RepID=UPI003B5A923F
MQSLQSRKLDKLARSVMEKVTNSSALRSNLSLVLDEVQFNQDSYVIERKGRPAAVIVPLTVFENWKRSRERFFETVRRIQEANKNADPDEVLQDVLEAQQAVRAELTQEQ